MPQCQAVSILKSEFDKRRQVHTNYSLRAFAKRASISPGLLSDIFNGRRNLTATMAHRIARRLDMGPDLLREFLKSTLELKDKRPQKQKESTIYHELTSDQFQIIAQWHAYALLSLLKVHPHITLRAASQKLGAAYFDIKDAAARLMKLNLLSKDKQDAWVCADNLSTTHDIPSEAIRSFHYEYLKQALQRMDSQPLEKSEYSTVVMAISRKNLLEAKTLIRRFRRELCKLLEDGVADETYALTIQLFSLEQ